MWQKAAERIRDSLGQVGYETWIAPLNFIGLHGQTAIIEAPNRFFLDWVKERYLELIQQTLSTEAGGSLKVSFTTHEDSGTRNNSNGNGSRSGSDRPCQRGTKVTAATDSRANRAEQKSPN